jgi:hypothetical protein
MPKEARPTIRSAEEITPNAKTIRVPALQRAIEEQGFSGPDLVITDDFLNGIIKGIVLHQLVAYDNVRRNRYHNAEHAEEVVMRTRGLVRRIKGFDSNDQKLMIIAAALHDLGHSGTTKRSAPDGLSNEEYTAALADQILSAHKFSVRQRVQMYGLIIGTTFGNPSVKPETKMEKVLSIADVGGFTKQWTQWVEESSFVLHETPVAERPATIEEWLHGRLKFLAWIESRLSELPEVEKYWRPYLEEKKQKVNYLLKIQAGPSMKSIRTFVVPLLRKSA